MQAAEHGHSMEAEARRILQDALKPPIPPPELISTIASGRASNRSAASNPFAAAWADARAADLRMIYLLDTNVLSETMKPGPSTAIAAWMREQPLRSLYTAAFCQAEILAGVAMLPAGRRRTELETMAQAIFGEDSRAAFFPSTPRRPTPTPSFSPSVAKGQPIETPDLIVAATARAHDAAVVTRDLGGFEGCGLTLVDPWTAA